MRICFKIKAVKDFFSFFLVIVLFYLRIRGALRSFSEIIQIGKINLNLLYFDFE